MLITLIRYLLLAGLGAWCFILIRPFLPLVLWGMVIAVALYPGFLWLGRRLGGRRKLAAAVIVIVGIGIIVGPVSLVVKTAVDYLQTFADLLDTGNLNISPPPLSVKELPVLGNGLFQLWQSANQNLTLVLKTYQPQIAALMTKLLTLAGTTGLGLVEFTVAIVVAGLLMLNANSLTQGLLRLILRLSPQRGPEFVGLAVTTIRNVARGVIGIAVLQTVLLGLGLFIAKIPLAALLTLGCFILSLIQIGPGIIVFGVLIYAWTHFAIIPALLFSIWMLAAGLCDNFLKPIVMAQGLTVPMLVIFLGVIGGTLSSGLLGLFIGPVILSLGYELVRAWVNEADPDLKEPAPLLPPLD